MDYSVTDLLLLVGAAFFASMLAAVAGFGGAAVLLPVLVAIFGPREAIPILTVAQLIGNASRVLFNRNELALPVVGWFSIGAVPLALLGGVLFAQAPLPVLTRFVGVFLLLSVAWRHIRQGPSRKPTLRNFALIGALFSFLSALVGSVGPLLAPFFLALGLAKGAYIGTEALATVVMHVTKLVAYGGASILAPSSVATGLTLGVILLLGSFVGKCLLDRLPERLFPPLIEAVLIISGLTLLLGG